MATLLRQLQKEEAMKRLELLKLFPNVITDFEKYERVYYSATISVILNAWLLLYLYTS